MPLTSALSETVELVLQWTCFKSFPWSINSQIAKDIMIFVGAQGETSMVLFLPRSLTFAVYTQPQRSEGPVHADKPHPGRTHGKDLVQVKFSSWSVCCCCMIASARHSDTWRWQKVPSQESVNIEKQQLIFNSFTVSSCPWSKCYIHDVSNLSARNTYSSQL